MRTLEETPLITIKTGEIITEKRATEKMADKVGSRSSFFVRNSSLLAFSFVMWPLFGSVEAD